MHGDAFRRANWSRAQTAGFLQRIAARLYAPINVSEVADDIGASASGVRRRFDELPEGFRASHWRGIVATRSELTSTIPMFPPCRRRCSTVDGAGNTYIQSTT